VIDPDIGVAISHHREDHMTHITKTTTTLLGERDIAYRLGVSLATVRRWRLLGQGPTYRKIGSSVRYDPDDLAAWLASRPTGGER